MSSLTGKLLDHYQLKEMVGQGGMATVYLAVDTRDQRLVAIKVLSPTISSDRRFLRRFRREANLVSQLKHPNIVPVLEYGQADGFVYAAMPYIEGDTLHQKMVRSRLSSAECARWIGQVAEALDFAHQHGVIHRDIKPSNVIISASGDAMLTDFGLARAIETHSSLTGSMLMGTPAYVSPEQGRGEELDGRSDQYSLGVILYEAHTGRLPFDNEAPMATVMAHIQEPPPRPRRFNPELPPDVEVVILKSLAKKQASRFESVKALNQAYQAALGGKALPEFDGIPAGLTVRLPPKAVEPIAPPIAAKGKRPRAWAPLLLIAVLAAASYFVFGILSGPRETIAEATSPVESDNPTVLGTSTVVLLPSPSPAPEPLTSDACPGITLFPPQVKGDQVSWLVDNASGVMARLTGLDLGGWPATQNGPIESIRWGDTSLVEGPLDLETELVLNATADPSLEAGESTLFSLGFSFEAGATGYHLGLTFDTGCTLAGSW